MESLPTPPPDETRKPLPVKRAEKSTPKHYVLDTNVLLHDPQSMFQFEENEVWIPADVIEELDKFKVESSTRGANAREVHRKLNECFPSQTEMEAGKKLANGGWLRVLINPNIRFEDGRVKLRTLSPRAKQVRAFFPDFSVTDNRILAAAVHLAESRAARTVLVSKDLNMQLKARVLGLDAQDYRTDRVDDADITRTARRSTPEDYDALDIPGHTLQAFASQERILIERHRSFPPNQYLLLRNEEEHTHAIPARHIGGGEFRKLRHEHVTIRGGRSFQALNLGQRFLLDALFDPDITLVTVYGKAGTGKTLLTVGAALEQVQCGDYEKMLITRVIMPTGKDIGFLPGDVQEKMQPWIQPALDALDLLLSRPRKPEQFDQKKHSSRKQHDDGGAHNAPPSAGSKVVRPYTPLIQSGLIEIEAITHIRGRSLPRAFFIVDEAQQLTPHEAKTLVTRMGRGSKIIMIGDLGQIDNPYVDAHTNGLVFTRNKLQGQAFMAHVNLFKGERSEMAEVAANLM